MKREIFVDKLSNCIFKKINLNHFQHCNLILVKRLEQIYFLGAIPLRKTPKTPLHEFNSSAERPLELRTSKIRRPKS
jgi:hypothetical protein